MGKSGAPEEGEVVLEDNQKSIIMGIIGQLRPGMDLSRITLPTFVLEPKSMLERITNFMSHPEFMLPIPTISDPVQRFVEVLRFYMAGWHVRPAGVRKPLNPILGEFFSGYWKFKDNSTALYIAEQVSHHPPISAYFYYSPENNVRIDGVLKPRSKFLGNSAGSMMEGQALLTLTNLDETYSLTQPNMYARGILFGTMRMELGDHSTVRCAKTDLIADIEFKTKGFIGGKYDTIHGTIRHESSGEKLYEIEGKWNEKMTIKNLKTKKTETFFDASNAQETPVATKSVDSMAERESRKLWRATADAIKARDQTTATNAKSFIEDAQRDEAKARHDKGESWKPTFFDEIGPEDYRFKAPQGVTGQALKERMEEMVGGITAQRTPTKATASTATAAAPRPQAASASTLSASGTSSHPVQAPSGASTTTTTSSVPSAYHSATTSVGSLPPQPHVSSSAAARQQPYNSTPATQQYRSTDFTPAAPLPGSAPTSHAPTERPALHPVDSENQPFVDAQESFEHLSINH